MPITHFYNIFSLAGVRSIFIFLILPHILRHRLVTLRHGLVLLADSFNNWSLVLLLDWWGSLWVIVNVGLVRVTSVAVILA